MYFATILFNEGNEKESESMLEDCQDAGGPESGNGNCRQNSKRAKPALNQADYRLHFLSQKMNFIGTSYSYLNAAMPTEDVGSSEQIIPDAEKQTIITEMVSEEVPQAEPP